MTVCAGENRSCQRYKWRRFFVVVVFVFFRERKHVRREGECRFFPLWKECDDKVKAGCFSAGRSAWGVQVKAVCFSSGWNTVKAVCFSTGGQCVSNVKAFWFYYRWTWCGSKVKAVCFSTFGKNVLVRWRPIFLSFYRRKEYVSKVKAVCFSTDGNSMLVSWRLFVFLHLERVC